MTKNVSVRLFSFEKITENLNHYKTRTVGNIAKGTTDEGTADIAASRLPLNKNPPEVTTSS